MWKVLGTLRYWGGGLRLMSLRDRVEGLGFLPGGRRTPEVLELVLAGLEPARSRHRGSWILARGESEGPRGPWGGAGLEPEGGGTWPGCPFCSSPPDL